MIEVYFRSSTSLCFLGEIGTEPIAWQLGYRRHEPLTTASGSLPQVRKLLLR
jgi:hypothetical protein